MPLAEVDSADSHTGIQLPVARFGAGVFASAELLHDDFRALGDRQDLRDDGSRLDGRLSDSQSVVVPIGQDPIEFQLFATGHFPVVKVQFLALLHFELASAVFDYCVHGKQWLYGLPDRSLMDGNRVYLI